MALCFKFSVNQTLFLKKDLVWKFSFCVSRFVGIGLARVFKKKKKKYFY